MRILQVNKFLYRRGGAEGYMLDLGELQSAAGHEVEYFSMQHPDNLEATYATAFPRRIELDPPPAGLAGRARVAANMVWSPGARSALTRVVEDFSPDVVHLHNIYHQLSPSILRPLRARAIPTVMTLHDYKLACPTYQFLDHGEICEACIGRRFHHAVARRCNGNSLAASAVVAVELGVHTATRAYSPVDIFICPSRFMLDKMHQAKVYPARLRHLPHFADVDGIEPATRPGTGVVVAGRLSSEKGVDVAIDAIASLPGVQMTICGDGPERAALERRAASAAPGRIRFTGRLDTTTLHQAIRDSAVVVVPSRWYENQPMIVLEALACGRPVIATDLGGLPELVRDGIDGWIVPANDAPSLARAIAAAVGDPDAAHRMGHAGRGRVLAEFSTEAHLRGLDALYEQAMGETA